MYLSPCSILINGRTKLPTKNLKTCHIKKKGPFQEKIINFLFLKGLFFIRSTGNGNIFMLFHFRLPLLLGNDNLQYAV